MALLPLILNPAPILRQPALPARLPLDKRTLNLAADMQSAVRRYRGIGLAAPQVNESLRLFVIATDSSTPRVYINPEILKTSANQIELEEGCLSLPGVFGIVKRPSEIHVRYLTPKQETCEEILQGLPARVYQHELDHLDGILFIDKALRITSGQELLN